MLITIDVGNSRIKVAVFEQNTQIELFVFEPKEAQKKIENIKSKSYLYDFHKILSKLSL